ncbi:MAG: hypothetical protein J6L93_02445 [Butyrivibrio sp.]|nr:hypothetical protein [Butyrivibrio sp.]
MVNYKNELENQLSELKNLEKKAANRLKSFKGLENGNIRVSRCNGSDQYHFRKEGEEKEHYISKYEMSKIKMLVQRDYDEKIHRELEHMIRRLEKFNKAYDIDLIERQFRKLPDGRKKLVDPITPTREMIIDEWYKNHPGGRNTYEIKHEFLTMKDETVRSKSEKMIADYLLTEGIPYVCEPRVILKDGSSAYPDFAALNLMKNKTIYIEHLGLVEKEDYATRNFFKIMDYEEVGIVLGDNLMITMETKDRPLDMKILKKKIQNFLC